MVVGLGIDLLEHGRMERELERGSWQPRDGVFTARELQACNAAIHPAAALAACFTVKEAALKALGLDLADFALLTEVEVRGAPGGDCEILLYGRVRLAAERLGVRRLWGSTTRTARRTGAVVILET